MHHFKASEISVKQQYKLVIGGVVPRPIAWVATLDKSEKVYNVAPYSYFSGASNELPLLTIAVLRVNGKMKDTARNILDTKEAVVHVVDVENAEAMNFTCTSLPREESELKLIDVELEESKSIKVQRIKGTKIQYETVMYQYVPINNEQGEIITDFFILKIVDFHIDESIYDLDSQYIITERLRPVARLAGNQYAVLGEEFSLKRPD
ncbi:flavin reductase family protein [Erysipelothrix sp. HDW6B]|uniref:flavin reductase family protein n=1 Tax=Erysipelothrix sp. HDW6B TaxID=2714929 RepID=UPI0014081FE0|nr:flavin reductase family protein [Erysipelothrix sp. HDW6B]QIK86640.1 flavin reductase family protein [Erysipelothrix sp. HDW6B]